MSDNSFQKKCTITISENEEGVLSCDLDQFYNLSLEDQEFFLDEIKRIAKLNAKQKQNEYKKNSLYFNFFNEGQFKDCRIEECSVEMSRTKGFEEVAVFPEKIEIGRYYKEDKLFYCKNEEITNPEEECYCFFFTHSLSSWCSYARIRKSDWVDLRKRFKKYVESIPNLDSYRKDIFLYDYLMNENDDVKGNLEIKKVVREMPFEYLGDDSVDFGSLDCLKNEF